MEKLIAQLRPMIEWNGFAYSLVSQFDSGKRLSIKQVEAAERMIAKMAANAKGKEAAASVNLDCVHSMFATAINNGLKKPRFRFYGLQLSMAAATSRNAGSVYVKAENAETGLMDYAGKITSGTFLPISAYSESGKSIAQRLQKIAADPIGAATQFGKDTGICACCGRLLTDPESVARGIGPICASNWGLI